MVFCSFTFLLITLGNFAAELRADNTSSGQVAPPIFFDSQDDCNLGLYGSCNDAGDYVAGPESILNTWLFSKAVPWWISFFLALTAGISVLMMMVGGVMINISAENEELLKKGQKTITWALLGLLIALFAFVAIAILETLPLPGSTAPALQP